MIGLIAAVLAAIVGFFYWMRGPALEDLGVWVLRLAMIAVEMACFVAVPILLIAALILFLQKRRRRALLFFLLAVAALIAAYVFAFVFAWLTGYEPVLPRGRW